MEYTCIDIDYLAGLIESKKIELADKEDQLAIYQFELEDLQADLAALQEELTVARNLLSQFETNLANQKSLLNEKIVEKQQVELQIIQIRQYIAFLELKLLNLQNEKADLQAYVNTQPQVVTAWCADYTLNLTGEVGIADVPGASGLDFQGVTYYSPAVTRQIRPGYEGRANYNSARDGILQHAKASAPANHFLQAVRHSAMMKWKPQYRYGKITAINHDTHRCSVELSPAYDKYIINGYNVNKTTELTGIPIEYMNCDSEFFESGDQVLIEYQGNSPKVVGYKQHPRPCCSCEIPESYELPMAFVVAPVDFITVNSSRLVTFSGGCGPFTWLVSGEAGPWSATPVNEREAIINSGCGGATVSVTDSCGNEISYNVRGGGIWVTDPVYQPPQGPNILPSWQNVYANEIRYSTGKTYHIETFGYASATQIWFDNSGSGRIPFIYQLGEWILGCDDLLYPYPATPRCTCDYAQHWGDYAQHWGDYTHGLDGPPITNEEIFESFKELLITDGYPVCSPFTLGQPELILPSNNLQSWRQPAWAGSCTCQSGDLYELSRDAEGNLVEKGPYSVSAMFYFISNTSQTFVCEEE